MASNLSTDIQLSSLTTIDELGELEITEFDATVLKELLKDPNEELQDSTEMGKDLPKEEKSIDGSLDNVQDFNWLDILEESPFPCEDVMIWYADLCTDEMISGVFETREVNDYFLTPSPALVASDEIAYIGLWEHN